MEGDLSWRHGLALLVTVTAALLMLFGTRLILTEPLHSGASHLMHVSLASPPAPPAPPKVQPKPPKPVVQKQASRTPLETSPHAVGPPAPTNAPVSSQNATPTPPAPAASAGPSENVSLESTYIASVRAAVEEKKRYPQSKDARLQQPRGTVTVVFTLTRDGELRDPHVDQSAGSILDRAALDTVRHTTYPPFPVGTWPAEDAHTFSVDLNFTPG